MHSASVEKINGDCDQHNLNTMSKRTKCMTILPFLPKFNLIEY